jgi:hypothetical protein
MNRADQVRPLGQAQTPVVTREIEQHDGRSSNIPPKEGENIEKRESLGNRTATKFDEPKGRFENLSTPAKVAIILGAVVGIAAAICAGIFAAPCIAAALAAFGVAAAVATAITTVGGIGLGAAVGGAAYGIGKAMEAAQQRREDEARSFLRNPARERREEPDPTRIRQQLTEEEWTSQQWMGGGRALDDSGVVWF